MTESDWRSSPRTPCPVCGDADGSCKKTEDLILCFKGEQNRDKAPAGYRFVKPAGDGMGGIFAPEQRQVKQEAETYVYYDADGHPYQQVKRFYSGGKKQFAQSHWDSRNWSKGLPKGFQRIPYNLNSFGKSDCVAILEGEKDCDTANQYGLSRTVGFVPTTNPQGAGKWPKGWGERYFAGKEVIIFPDNDKPGRDHARQVWADVQPFAQTVVVVLLPGLPDKGDLTDYLELGGTVKSVHEMIDQAFAHPELYGIDQLDALDAELTQPCDQPPSPPPGEETPPIPEPTLFNRAPVEDPQKPLLAKRFDAVKLAVGNTLRLNLLTKEIEFEGEKIEYDDLVLRLACESYINLPDSQAKKIFLAIAKQNTYHPIVDYLNSVAEQHGSDASLLDEIAPKYLGTDEPLHATLVRKWLISAVKRVFEPGCQVDNVLILQGKQWAGKSTFFQTLASTAWFDDTMGNITEKDERLKMHLAWICEWAELEQVFKRKEISTVKSFITTKEDIIRPPYAERLQRMARQGVIVGTTNEDQLFGDVTGNRRYWMVPVKKEIDTQLLALERDKIWAAAVAAYRAGQTHFLSKDEFLLSEQQNTEYAFTDPWDSIIEPYVQHLPRVTTLEIMRDCLKLPIERLDRAAQNRVASSLRRLGWQQRVLKVLGKNQRVWVLNI